MITETKLEEILRMGVASIAASPGDFRRLAYAIADLIPEMPEAEEEAMRTLAAAYIKIHIEARAPLNFLFFLGFCCGMAACLRGLGSIATPSGTPLATFTFVEEGDR